MKSVFRGITSEERQMFDQILYRISSNLETMKRGEE